MHAGSTSADAHAELGLVLFALGRQPAARKHLLQAEELGHDNADAHVAMAGLHIASGNPAAGINGLRRALRVEPDSIAAANNLAWHLATLPDGELRDPIEAIRLAEHAAALTGRQNAEVLDTLARALASGGRFARAVSVLEEAIALVSEDRERVRELRAAQARYGRADAGRPGS